MTQDSIATATDGPAAAGFLLPPVLHNAQGRLRRAGFEFEYAGLDLFASARLVQQLFPGVHTVRNTFVHEVDSPAGRFRVEIDSTFLKERKYEPALRAMGVDPEGRDTKWLEEKVRAVAGTMVPIEISTPPLPLTDLARLDVLRARLRDAGANGTRTALWYAFGMHINPEAPSLEPAALLAHLRAFLLLYPWLKSRSEVDLTRSISPYIKPFPAAYARLVLDPDYDATAGRLVEDYLSHNPTRNRPLDMTPVLACLDEARVNALVQEKHLVTPRPAFHYRLPNCMVDEEHWTLAAEWNRWVEVERLASDPARLAAMSRDYLAADQQSLRPFIDRWPGVLAQHLEQ